MQQLFGALIVMVVGVAGCAFYFFATNWILDAIYPAKGTDPVRAGANIRRASQIRPWLFLGPAILALGLYLVYPVFDSIRLSLHDRGGQNFVGTSNYAWMLNDPGFRESMRNNLMWLVVVPAAATGLGLLIAALTDRIWWGNIAKA